MNPPMDEQQIFRANVLTELGATAAEIKELLAYNQNVFDHSQLKFPLVFPLPPEPHVAVWQAYADDGQKIGVMLALKKRLAQLAFPIRAGISQTDDYRAATRRGEPSDGMREATGLVLHRPDQLELVIHPSIAGPLPVLIAGDRADFVALVRALLNRNEPVVIPDSMGAVMVAGFNNWDRVRRYRAQWQTENPFGDWDAEFQRLIPQHELYQDRFIILSQGAYSAVAAQAVGCADEEWRQLSLTIRLEHECTHYITRRVLGSMRNNLMDELLADYRGIVAAAGRFHADWFLRFVGLEQFPVYRPGGRLQNYRGEPPLSDGAFRILHVLVKDAAENLERFDRAHAAELGTPLGQAHWLIALTYLTMEELACRQADLLLEKTWKQIRRMNGYESIGHLS